MVEAVSAVLVRPYQKPDHQPTATSTGDIPRGSLPRWVSDPGSVDVPKEIRLLEEGRVHSTVHVYFPLRQNFSHVAVGSLY